jgi:uncharacterized membrane protein (DUF2068 family)
MGERRGRLIVPIGVFRLVKAALLIALGVGGLVTMPESLADLAQRVLIWTGGRSGHVVVVHLAQRVFSLDRSTEQRLSVLSLAYAAVFVVEGVGLVRRRRWAEWLTVIVTGSFIPIEIYELVQHPGGAKVAALVINVAIVVYLVLVRLAEARSR